MKNDKWKYATHMPNGKIRAIDYNMFRALKAMGGLVYTHEGTTYVCIKGAKQLPDGSIDF